MAEQKITVSLDEVNSSHVDAELHRQDVASRMAAHQEKIRINFGGSGEMLGAKGGFFRKAIVYMAVFGIISSVIAWGLGECVIKASDSHPWPVAQSVIAYIFKEYPNASKDQFNRLLETARKNLKNQENNPYLQESFWTQPQDALDKKIEEAKSEVQNLMALYSILAAMIIGIGLSVAEAMVSKNVSMTLKNAILGAVLGAIGGWLVSLFIGQLYNAMGGGQDTGLTFQQMIARGIAWGILGLFIAISPGIIMKSWKKLLLGLIGGLVGGVIGGLLFDPICIGFKSVAFARFVNIVGLGVGAAVATVFLENVAKQGWLKVAAGIIMGKQFILYRNPTVIGSSPKCEIYLFKDPSVAPKHAAINNRNGDFIVTAIEGATVLINNIPARQQKLKSGDQLKIGNTVFIFEAKALKNKN